MTSIIDECYKRAIEVLEKCITPQGLYASGTPDGYTSVWSRDGNIALLGGALVHNKFQKVFSDTLETLVKHQSPSGQIPNCVGLYDELRKSEITYNTIDSSLWFIIGEYVYAKAYNDKDLLQKHQSAIEKAFFWLKAQDWSEEHLPAQLPTTDWQDAFPHKYGRTINTLALYYIALRLSGNLNEAQEVQNRVAANNYPHLKLFDDKRGYFLPWIWKSHAGDREEEYWFDSLGNLLAIISGLAFPEQTKSILNYIEKERINKPFPVKTIFPAIKPRSKLWKSYFAECDARKPYHYLNAGIWPFIGGFYIAALVKTGQFQKAEQELERLAIANKVGREIEFEFNEWLDGKKGKPMGGVYQAWSIGMYIYAYECVKAKKLLLFDD